jgi:archaellum component FlaG (FlaF/FlaG flagellin family)
MRQLVFFAVVLVVAGSYAARFANRAVETRTELRPRSSNPQLSYLNRALRAAP